MPISGPQTPEKLSKKDYSVGQGWLPTTKSVFCSM